MSATVIIPTYRERGNIGRLVRDVLAQGSEFRVLAAVDSSGDGTVEEARALSHEFPGRPQAGCHQHRRGPGPAYVDGFAKALEEGAGRAVDQGRVA